MLAARDVVATSTAAAGRVVVDYSGRTSIVAVVDMAFATEGKAAG
jgi:hypothetical protein